MAAGVQAFLLAVQEQGAGKEINKEEHQNHREQIMNIPFQQ
jgi:hypothetical protein